jgi:chromosome segregation ATPase
VHTTSTDAVWEPGAESPALRIAACEDELALIATDLGQLLEELGRLRAGGDAFAGQLAERDVAIDLHLQALDSAEAECARLNKRAEEASEALRLADARLRELNEHVETIAREADALRGAGAEREQHVRALEVELSRTQALLLERERSLEQERASSKRAVEIGELWQLRAADLQRQLAKAEVELEKRSVLARAASQAPADERAVSRLPGHLRLIAGSDGYRLTASGEDCPDVGDRVVVNGVELHVIRIGRSPMFGDERPCVFLQATAAG